jgi:hypothetical protein
MFFPSYATQELNASGAQINALAPTFLSLGLDTRAMKCFALTVSFMVYVMSHRSQVGFINSLVVGQPTTHVLSPTHFS